MVEPVKLACFFCPGETYNPDGICGKCKKAGRSYDEPLWSILICTLASRRDKLERLLGVLLPQCEADGRVEVVACWDNGQAPVAVKRQRLLEAAAGKYLSYADDDDLVDEEFVELVTAAMAGGPDYVAFGNIYYVAGVRQPVEVRVGLQYGGWHDDVAAGVLYRDVTHVNPVRSSIAKQADFRGGPGWVGEDWAYTETVRRLAGTEAVIGRPLYHYLHDPADSVQYGTQQPSTAPRLPVSSPCFRWI